MLGRLRELVRPYYLRYFYFRVFPNRRPSYFSDCWKYPEARPALVRGQTVIIFMPMNDWHTRMQRTQHLASALSRRGYLVIYINPHLGRQFPEPFDRRQPVRLISLSPNLFELHVHLPREPVFHHRPLTSAESGRIAAAVADLLSELSRPRTIQILAFPIWLKAALEIRQQFNAPILYDCHDYLPGFTAIAPAILALEPDTFRASALSLCSAASLADRAKSLAPAVPTALIRNGATGEFGQIVRAPTRPIIVGYIGALDSWFDVPSFEAAAIAHPEWRFQLIGRVEHGSLGKLAGCKNVEFVGEAVFEQLGGFLSAFTVATIPFLLNPLIAATDPIKVYEYLAAGLPVVSAALPELDRLGGLIYRYRDPADFVRQLEIAIASDTPGQAAQRRMWAASETWEDRASQLAEILSGLG